MNAHAKILSNDSSLSPNSPGLYGVKFYPSADPTDAKNKVVKISTSNTTHNISSTTSIEGNQICQSPSSFVFEMRYFFEPIWYYSQKYFCIEFCNRANSRCFALAFNVSDGESNLAAEKISISLEEDESMQDISLLAYRWYTIRFEYYQDINAKERRLKIFLGEGDEKLSLVRDVQLNVRSELPTRALMLHSATKIKGISYLDDLSFTLTDAKYSQAEALSLIPSGKKKIYDFEDGIPSQSDFFVEMRLKHFDNFLTMDPASWSAPQVSSQVKHSHSQCEILFVQLGKGTFIDEWGEHPIFEGSIVIVPAGVKHCVVSDQNYNIISISGDFDQLSRIDVPRILHDNVYGEGKKLAELALYNRFNKEEYFSALCDAFIHFIILNLEYPKSDLTAVVYRMMDYMKNNYSNIELSVVQLLKDSGYAKDYVRTKFFEITKMTPKKYLTTIRMRKAKEILTLRGDDISISKVAEQCGIVDPVVFSKNFKQFYGVSPKQFIKKRNGN